MQAQVHHPGHCADTAGLRARAAALFRAPKERTTLRARGRDCVLRRDALWFAVPGEDGAMPLYRTYATAYRAPATTAGVDSAEAPRAMPAWMRQTLRGLSTTLGIPPLNHVVLHRYVDGNDVIGDHHDKYMDIAPGSTILSLSLGATRDFRIGGETFAVRDGDVVAIPYDLNRRVKHGIPRRRRISKVRYSLTARAIDTFYDPQRKVLVRTRLGPVKA